MAIRGGPDIIEDGLVLHLDAADRNSYPANPELVTNSSLFTIGDGNYDTCLRSSSLTTGLPIGPIVSGRTYQLIWNVSARRGTTSATFRKDFYVLSQSTNANFGTGMKHHVFTSDQTGTLWFYGDGNGCDFDVDYASLREYPSSSSISDLASGYSGSLTNGPVFTQGNAGSIRFDGVNDYVDLSTYLNSIGSYATIESFFKSNNGATGFCILFGWGDGDNYYSNFGIGNWFNLWGDESIYLGVNSTNAVLAERSGHSKYHDGNWHHAVATIGLNNYRIYVDGQLKTTSFAYGSASYNPSNIFGFSANTVARIGSRPYGSGSGWFDGHIASTKVYNRVLSASEVLQNYNATKGRYGL